MVNVYFVAIPFIRFSYHQIINFPCGTFLSAYPEIYTRRCESNLGCITINSVYENSVTPYMADAILSKYGPNLFMPNTGVGSY